MMKKIFSIAIGMALLAACSHKPEPLTYDQLADSILNLEEALHSRDVNADTTKANLIVDLYTQFATQYPEDSLAPIYLMRAAEIDINMGNFEPAVSLLDSVILLYPGFEDVAGCQFMKGWAYELNQQYDLAREAYTEFVTNYPDHFLAADTRKMLPYVGMTPEEQLAAATAR